VHTQFTVGQPGFRMNSRSLLMPVRAGALVSAAAELDLRRHRGLQREHHGRRRRGAGHLRGQQCCVCRPRRGRVGRRAARAQCQSADKRRSVALGVQLSTLSLVQGWREGGETGPEGKVRRRARVRRPGTQSARAPLRPQCPQLQQVRRTLTPSSWWQKALEGSRVGRAGCAGARGRPALPTWDPSSALSATNLTVPVAADLLGLRALRALGCVASLRAWKPHACATSARPLRTRLRHPCLSYVAPQLVHQALPLVRAQAVCSFSAAPDPPVPRSAHAALQAWQATCTTPTCGVHGGHIIEYGVSESQARPRPT
jgi:hypothetical protein